MPDYSCKFENSQLSFDNSHQPVITFVSNKKNKTEITNKLLILLIFLNDEFY
jgi:hypothetical protein